MAEDSIAIPIPAQFVAPWIEDNGRFISEVIAQRNAALAAVRDKRDQTIIRKAEPCARAQLAAVDAGYSRTELGDLLSILIQAVYVDDFGIPTLPAPLRITGVNGHEISQLATPARVVEECALLSKSESVVVADTSFWSLLMEVNQAITLREHHPHPDLIKAVKRLTEDGLFLACIENPRVIAMSKKGEAQTVQKGISDREAWGVILDAGEYTKPRAIAEALQASFGIEKRGFTERERQRIRDIYTNELGVVYYKAHDWGRAYRIEAHMSILKDAGLLMPMLAAVHHHTTDRTIIEPWPQFMADYVAKQLRNVAPLYGGGLNRHRTLINSMRTGERS